jgi:hypothetical protein
MAAALPRAFVLALALAAGGCGGGEEPDPPDEGQLLVDSALVLDRFPFSRAACDEVLPDGFANADSLPPGTAARLAVNSIACYAASIRIEDSLGAPVRALERYFDIPGRDDDDKERGVIGYLAWDGKDEAGADVPPGAYLWRLEFRFGAGRSVRYRADMRLE